MKYMLLLAALALGGCSITGTDSKSSFACQAPEGVQCMTTSGVYYNSLANNLPALKTATAAPGTSAANAPSERETGGDKKLLSAPPEPPAVARFGIGARAPDFSPAGAIRAVPRVMRVWILPWEDADGDLHDQAYIYMAVDSGHWLVEKTRKAVKPPRAGTTLLVGDGTSTGELSQTDGEKSGFARGLEKLSPATSAAPR